MKTRLTIELPSSSIEEKEQLWCFGARLLVAGMKEDGHLICHDFTPPPFRKKYEYILREAGAKILPFDDGIGIEFTTVEQIVSCLRFINWSSALVIRIEGNPLATAPIPEVRKRFFAPKLDEWYEVNEDGFRVVAYFGINPEPAVEIVSNAFGHDEFRNIYADALRTVGMRIREMDVRVVAVRDV